MYGQWEDTHSNTVRPLRRLRSGGAFALSATGRSTAAISAPLRAEATSCRSNLLLSAAVKRRSTPINLGTFMDLPSAAGGAAVWSDMPKESAMLCFSLWMLRTSAADTKKTTPASKRKQVMPFPKGMTCSLMIFRERLKLIIYIIPEFYQQRKPGGRIFFDL